MQIRVGVGHAFLVPKPAVDVAEVGVDHVGQRGHEHGDAGSGSSPGGADAEGQVVLVVAGAEAGRVDAAWQVRRNGQLEGRFPGHVFNVVVVEVDGAVFVGSEVEVGLGAGEVVAGDAAGGHVDGLAV